eukprot:551070_1
MTVGLYIVLMLTMVRIMNASSNQMSYRQSKKNKDLTPLNKHRRLVINHYFNDSAKHQSLYKVTKLRTKNTTNVNIPKNVVTITYSCMYCLRSLFKNYSDYRNHLKVIHLKTGYLCDYCPIIFPTKNGQIAHTRQHTCSNVFKCDICQELFHCETSFSTQDDLSRHKHQIHQIKDNMDYFIRKKSSLTSKRSSLATTEVNITDCDMNPITIQSIRFPILSDPGRLYTLGQTVFLAVIILFIIGAVIFWLITI